MAMIPTGTAKFDLLLSITCGDHGARCAFEYRTDLFERATLERIARAWRRFIAAAAAEPAARVGALAVLEPEESSLLASFNSTATHYPRHQCIHARFEEVVRQSPDAVALTFGELGLTYSQLNRQANALAHRLRSTGIGPDAMVGVYMDRSPHAVVAMLAILKAGGAYVPLDPAYPAQRIAFIVEDTRACVVLSTRGLAARLPATRAQVIAIDEPGMEVTRADDPQVVSEAIDLAYVMYTSGSTGKPKGVQVPHRAVMRLLLGVGYAHLGPQEAVLHMAPPAFDASTFEVWGALLHGGRCVIAPPGGLTLAELERVIVAGGVTCAWLTASLFNTVIDERPGALADVKQVITGGEALSVPHIRKALAALPNTTLINGYGPTECTTFACCHTIPRRLPPHLASIPIGRPIANTRAYILDGRLQRQPIGVAGDLYLGGDGLARGYLNQPALTAERFIADPFDASEGARLYRTGDLARWLPDGTIEFMGRNDQQVKVRGFRIEPGEIEAALAGHPAVRQAVVIAQNESGRDTRLTAYVATDDPAAAPTLESWLHERLPAYMIPAEFVAMRDLPVTPNGKIDRARLPAPSVAPAQSTPPRPPRGEIERQLVAIWRDLLKTDAVGIDDDFFELGGHSLLAVYLFARIQDRFGKDLPLATLFDHPTIAALAAMIGGEGDADPGGSLVALRTTGQRPPLFLVHGVAGDILFYRPLLDHMPLDQPLYGLQAPGLTGEHPQEQSTTALASHYVDLMRRVQPKGPYFIGGFSSGGSLAFEMAQQIIGAGEGIGLLLVIDTSPPNIEPAYGWWSPSAAVNFLLNLPCWLLDDVLRCPPRRLLSRALGRLRSMRGRRHAAEVLDAELDIERVFGVNDLPPRRLAFIQSLYRGWLNYRPRSFPGSVTLLRARTKPLLSRHNSTLGWDQLARDGVEVIIVPGSHDSLFKKAHVATLARRIDERLLRAQAAAAP
jgi:aspartate racemase